MKKKQRNKPPIICACDPHTSSPAFAIFQGRRLLAKKVTTGEPAKLLFEIKEAIDTWHPSLLVIENQYLPLSIDAVRRFRSVSSLIAARAMITAVFILSGVECRVIEPLRLATNLGRLGPRPGQASRPSRSSKPLPLPGKGSTITTWPMPSTGDSGGRRTTCPLLFPGRNLELPPFLCYIVAHMEKIL